MTYTVYWGYKLSIHGTLNSTEIDFRGTDISHHNHNRRNIMHKGTRDGLVRDTLFVTTWNTSVNAVCPQSTYNSSHPCLSAAVRYGARLMRSQSDLNVDNGDTLIPGVNIIRLMWSKPFFAIPIRL